MPGVEARDCGPERGQLDVGIERVHVSPMAVTHEFLAHIRDHASFNQSRVEGVAKIVKSVVRNPGTAQGPCPTGFEVFEWAAFVGKYWSGGLARCREQGVDPVGHGDQPVLALGGFGVGN